MTAPTFTPLWPIVETAIMQRQPPGYQPHDSNGWRQYHSPLREDRNPSFSVKPDTADDPGAWKDHGTGDHGSIADLAAALGLDPRISANDPSGPSRNGHQQAPATLRGFCNTRNLDAGRLCGVWNVRQVTWGDKRTGKQRQALRYRTPLGNDRLKFLDGEKPKYGWVKQGGHRHWYGLAQAQRLGGDMLYVVNGEPSVWACYQAGVAAVCLCGGEGNVPPPGLATELRTAMGSGGFRAICVIYDVGEPHDAPDKGSRAVAAALRAGGVVAKACTLPASLGMGGDVDDLHRLVGDAGLAGALAALPRLDANGGAEEGWERPVPMATREGLPEFPIDALDGWARAMVEATAVAIQTPLAMPAMYLLAVLAAILQKKVVAHPKPGWVEPVNLWVVLAAEPGENKSTVCEILAQPLWEEQWRREQEVAAEQAQAETQLSYKSQQVAEIERKAARSDSADERNTLLEQARTLRTEIAATPIPHAQRLLTHDSTPERLATLMRENGDKMAVISAEGGIFDVMAGRYSNGVPYIDVYLMGHAGDNLTVDRQGRPSFTLRKPALTLGLAVQPRALDEMLGNKIFRGRGLHARFAYLFPDSRVGFRDIDAPPIPAEIQGRYTEMIGKLLKLPFGEGLNQEETPHALLFSPEASERFREMRKAHEEQLRPGGALHHLKDWANKYPGLVARLAGLLHVAEHAEYIEVRKPWDAPISGATLDRAIRIGAYLQAHAKAAYATTGLNPTVAHAQHILTWIKRKGLHEFSERDAFHDLEHRFDSPDALRAALQVLVERHYVRPLAEPERPKEERAKGGRPRSPRYEVNPAVAQDTHDDDASENATDRGFVGFGSFADTFHGADGGDGSAEGAEEIEEVRI